MTTISLCESLPVYRRESRQRCTQCMWAPPARAVRAVAVRVLVSEIRARFSAFFRALAVAFDINDNLYAVRSRDCRETSDESGITVPVRTAGDLCLVSALTAHSSRATRGNLRLPRPMLQSTRPAGMRSDASMRASSHLLPGGGGLLEMRRAQYMAHHGTARMAYDRRLDPPCSTSTLSCSPV